MGKPFAVAMALTRPNGSGVEIELRLVTLTAKSREEAIGFAVPEVWKDFKGYQLSNLVASEWVERPQDKETQP